MSSGPRHADLSMLTSMQVGGWARDLYEPGSFEELCELLASLDDPFILGGGCNTVFPDEDFCRPVIRTRKLGELRIQENGRVYAEAGVGINQIIRQTVNAGLAGLEKLAGIPGTVGGGTAMNAGNGPDACFGKHIRELHIVSPEDGAVRTIRGSEVPWRYRDWNMPGWVVAAVEMELQPGDQVELRREMEYYNKRKRKTQPLVHASSGCMFRNPGGGPSAGRLIQDCNLMGLSRGGAAVSTLHANFIVNSAGGKKREHSATSGDVRRLMEEVIRQVREHTGYLLEPEVVFARDLAFA